MLDVDNLFQSMLSVVITMKNNKIVNVVVKFLRMNIVSLISFLLGMIVVLCFIKNNNYSDAISAIANTIMAIAAIFGLVFAKKWKRDATKDKVIEKCIKILSVYLFDSRRYFVSALYMNVFKFWFESFSKKGITSYKDVVQMKKMAFNYFEAIKKESVIYTGFSSDLEYLKLLSWEVKREHKDVITKIKQSMNDIISKEHELLALINIVFGMWNLNVYDDDESKGHTELSFNISHDPRVEYALILIPEIIRLKEDLNPSIQELLDKELNVFSFVEQVER